jgi:uncharacterized membrane protein YedE/YeeE
MRYLATAALGTFMGFSLSRIGFSDFGEVHRMFTLRDFRLLLTFAGAVAVSMLGAKLLESRTSATPKPLNPGTVLGGALFGVGWALTGACPAVVLVQLGEGRLVALATLTGIVVGCWVYPKVHARCFPWDAGSCDG